MQINRDSRDKAKRDKAKTEENDVLNIPFIRPIPFNPIDSIPMQTIDYLNISESIEDSLGRQTQTSFHQVSTIHQQNL